jgi:lysophospholipase L1-like esterase
MGSDLSSLKSAFSDITEETANMINLTDMAKIRNMGLASLNISHNTIAMQSAGLSGSECIRIIVPELTQGETYYVHGKCSVKSGTFCLLIGAFKGVSESSTGTWVANVKSVESAGEFSVFYTPNTSGVNALSFAITTNSDIAVRTEELSEIMLVHSNTAVEYISNPNAVDYTARNAVLKSSEEIRNTYDNIIDAIDDLGTFTRDNFVSNGSFEYYDDADLTTVTAAFLNNYTHAIDTSSAASALKYYKIPVVPGDVFYVSGLAYYNMALFGYEDAAGNIVSWYPETPVGDTHITYDGVETKAPLGSKYLIVNDGTGWQTSYPKPLISRTLGTVIEKAVMIEPQTAFIEDYFVHVNGSITADGNMDYYKIPVTPGDVYTITNTLRFNTALYGLMFESGATSKIVSVYPTSSVGSTATEYTETVTIPNNVNYLLVNNTSHWLNAPLPSVVKAGCADYFIGKNYKLHGEQIVDTVGNIAPLFGKKINVIGDSMVKGHTLSADKVWTTLLANRNQCTVRNYGANGSYLSNHNYINPQEQTIYPVVVRYSDMDDDADYVVVFAGTNDANHNIDIGTEDSTDTETIMGAMNILCVGLITKYPTSKIAFITPYLRSNNDAYKNTIDAIETICRKYSIPVFNNRYNGGIYWLDATLQTDLKLDSTHLTAAGMQYVARKYEAFLDTL